MTTHTPETAWLTEELHARFMASGLTKYSHNDILSAFAELTDMQAAFHALWLDKHALVAQYEVFELDGVTVSIPLPVYPSELEAFASELYTLSAGTPNTAVFQPPFPVKTWQKLLGQWKRHYARLANLRVAQEAVA